MIAIEKLSLGAAPYIGHFVTLLLAIVAISHLIHLWSHPSRQTARDFVARAWDAWVLFLRSQLDYPELPAGRSRWKPVSILEAIKALPSISSSLLFLGFFILIVLGEAFYGLDNPALSPSTHLMILAFLIAVVTFARMLMVHGVKTWHGIR
jgi:hypothetical protein